MRRLQTLSRQILAWWQILKIVAATLTCCLFSTYFVKSIVQSSYLLFIFKYSFIILLQGPQRYLIFICKVKATSHLPPGNPYPLFSLLLTSEASHVYFHLEMNALSAELFFWFDTNFYAERCFMIVFSSVKEQRHKLDLKSNLVPNAHQNKQIVNL